jgi:hypothetical protein
MLATDCLGVSREINEGSLSSYATILKEIEERRRTFHSLIVIHEKRKMNTETHNLAKSVVNLEPGRHVLFGITPDPLLVPLKLC